MKSNPAESSSSPDRNDRGDATDAGDTSQVGFQFAFSPAFRVAAMAAGVCPSNSCVLVDGERLDAKFGPWRVTTPLSNIAGAEVTGPYAWPKVIGPAHLSAKDRGLTFGTNNRHGVCIRFHQPVSGIDPWGIIRHPALTVTVADTASLAELLSAGAHGMDRTHGSLGEEDTIADLREEVNLELASLTAAELRQRAAERGIERTSRMSKADLIEALELPDAS